VTIVACPLLSWTKSSTVVGDSCHVHSLSLLSASVQVQGSGYSESKVETDAAALQLEISVTALELETDVAGLELETSAAGLKLETDATGLKLETNAGALKLETDTIALDLETKIDVPQEISKRERYSAD
jgi:hypothetical protein